MEKSIAKLEMVLEVEDPCGEGAAELYEGLNSGGFAAAHAATRGFMNRRHSGGTNASSTSEA